MTWWEIILVLVVCSWFVLLLWVFLAEMEGTKGPQDWLLGYTCEATEIEGSPGMYTFVITTDREPERRLVFKGDFYTSRGASVKEWVRHKARSAVRDRNEQLRAMRREEDRPERIVL